MPKPCCLAGVKPDPGFLQRLQSVDPAVTDATYAAETYDAVALVALSACARTEPQPEPAPATTAASALPSMDMAPFTVEVPSHDLERVPEASVAVLEGEDPDHHGAWLQVSGAPAWTDAMAGAVRDQIDQYRRDTDPSADPRLEIQPQLAVVAEDIAAARLLATERRGTDSVSTSHVIWYSAREDRVLETADLFTPDGWDAFRAEVRQRAFGDPDAVSFGDYHVAKDVGWALTGTPFDDDQLEEFLEQPRPDEVRALFRSGTGRALELFRLRNRGPRGRRPARRSPPRTSKVSS